MGIFFTWIILSILAGVLGNERKIGATAAFFISLILSPLIGFIVVIASTKNETIEYQEKILNATKEQVVKPTSNLEELEKLHELLQKGILTQEEYDVQKVKILNKE
jgi:predicted lipid-binding transport protein (Tim44 family)